MYPKHRLQATAKKLPAVSSQVVDTEESEGEYSPTHPTLARLNVSLASSTYNDDQRKSNADYMELSLQSQYNKRTL
jgi:hypothetical protein